MSQCVKNNNNNKEDMHHMQDGFVEIAISTHNFEKKNKKIYQIHYNNMNIYMICNGKRRKKKTIKRALVIMH